MRSSCGELGQKVPSTPQNRAVWAMAGPAQPAAALLSGETQATALVELLALS